MGPYNKFLEHSCKFGHVTFFKVRTILVLGSLGIDCPHKIVEDKGGGNPSVPDFHTDGFEAILQSANKRSARWSRSRAYTTLEGLFKSILVTFMRCPTASVNAGV